VQRCWTSHYGCLALAAAEVDSLISLLFMAYPNHHSFTQIICIQTTFNGSLQFVLNSVAGTKLIIYYAPFLEQPNMTAAFVSFPRV